MESNETDRKDIRRPMNAFLIFCKRHRSMVRERNPHMDNRSVTRILGDLWAHLDDSEKTKYTDLAKQYKDAFMKANPDYKWHNPEKANTPITFSKPQTRPVKGKGKGETSDSPEHSLTPGKLADPSNMGGLSILLPTSGKSNMQMMLEQENIQLMQISDPECSSVSDSGMDVIKKTLSYDKVTEKGKERVTGESIGQEVYEREVTMTTSDQSSFPEEAVFMQTDAYDKKNYMDPLSSKEKMCKDSDSLDTRPQVISMETSGNNVNQRREEDPIVTCGKIVMDHIIDQLYYTSKYGHLKPTPGRAASRVFQDTVPVSQNAEIISRDVSALATSHTTASLSREAQTISNEAAAISDNAAVISHNTKGISHNTAGIYNDAPVRVRENATNISQSTANIYDKEENSKVFENLNLSRDQLERKLLEDNGSFSAVIARMNSVTKPGFDPKIPSSGTLSESSFGDFPMKMSSISREVIHKQEGIDLINISHDAAVNSYDAKELEKRIELANISRDVAFISQDAIQLKKKMELANKGRARKRCYSEGVITTLRKDEDFREPDSIQTESANYRFKKEKKGKEDMEDSDDLAPVRKSKRRNRGQRYQELINEGIIQPSKERSLSRKPDTVVKDQRTSVSQELPGPDEDLGYDVLSVYPRQIRKRTMSESERTRSVDDPKRYKTGDFDLEAQIATLPACSLEKMKSKRTVHRTRHVSESSTKSTDSKEGGESMLSSKKGENSSFDKMESKTEVVLTMPPHLKNAEVSNSPVTGSRKRKARKHSITHLMPVTKNDLAVTSVSPVKDSVEHADKTEILTEQMVATPIYERKITSDSQIKADTEPVKTSLIKGDTESEEILSGSCRDNSEKGLAECIRKECDEDQQRYNEKNKDVDGVGLDEIKRNKQEHCPDTVLTSSVSQCLNREFKMNTDINESGGNDLLKENAKDGQFFNVKVESGQILKGPNRETSCDTVTTNIRSDVGSVRTKNANAADCHGDVTATNIKYDDVISRSHENVVTMTTKSDARYSSDNDADISYCDKINSPQVENISVGDSSILLSSNEMLSNLTPLGAIVSSSSESKGLSNANMSSALSFEMGTIVQSDLPNYVESDSHKRNPGAKTCEHFGSSVNANLHNTGAQNATIKSEDFFSEKEKIVINDNITEESHVNGSDQQLSSLRDNIEEQTNADKGRALSQYMTIEGNVASIPGDSCRVISLDINSPVPGSDSSAQNVPTSNFHLGYVNS